MASKFTYEDLISNWEIILKEFKKFRKNNDWTRIKHNCLAILEVHRNHKPSIRKFSKENLSKTRDFENCIHNIFRVIKENRKDKEKQYEKQYKLMTEIAHGKAKSH